MQIQTIIDNIDRTINGKTLLLVRMETNYESPAAIQYLKLNLEELKNIRNDLAKVQNESGQHS